jgi:hypothetical protein
VFSFDSGEAGSDLVERFVPGDPLELAAALGAAAPQRMQQTLGMMDTLGVAGDLLADHAGGIGIVLGAADAADGVDIDDVDVQRAGRGAIMRADRAGCTDGDGLVHGPRVTDRGAALN